MHSTTRRKGLMQRNCYEAFNEKGVELSTPFFIVPDCIDAVLDYAGNYSYWSGPSATHSYTGSGGTAADGHNYQDIDVINLINPSGNLQDYYLRVYEWTESKLESITDDLVGLYE